MHDTVNLKNIVFHFQLSLVGEGKVLQPLEETADTAIEEETTKTKSST